jgi:hypothetical protein
MCDRTTVKSVMRAAAYPSLARKLDETFQRGSTGGILRVGPSVAREWTDWADPDPYSELGLLPRRWDVDLLLDLVNLLEQLRSPSSRELPKGD